MKSETSPLSTDELLDHTAWIRALARGLVHDKSAVEDLVQETWLAFLRRRPSDEESIRPWLARVLRNQAALRLRRLRNGEVRERETAPGAELPSALELVERAETQKRLVEAVLELDEPYRGTVLLRYFEGLSAVQIARRRAMPAATVRTHLKRGLDRLREKFDAEAEGDRRAWVGALLPLAGVRAPHMIGIEEVSRGLLRDSLRWLAGGMVATAATLVGVTLLVGVGDPGTSLASTSAPPPPVVTVPPATGTGPQAPAGAGSARQPLGRAQSTPVAQAPSVRLLHGDDGSPLGGYRVRMRGPGGAYAEKITDANGRIVLSKEAPLGPWSLDLVDHPGLKRRNVGIHGANAPSIDALEPRTTEHQLVAGQSSLIVDAGPSYPLQLDLPTGVTSADLVAHLRAGRDAMFRHDNLSQQLTPVRSGLAQEGDGGTEEATWVRFAPLTDHFTKQGLKATLEVFSEDGLFWGEADVGTIIGTGSGPVAVTVEPRAVLHGVVSDEGGPTTMLNINLTRADGTRLKPANPDADGNFRIPWLEPGTYTIRVDSPRHRPREVVVRLGGGEAFLLDLDLEQHAIAGPVAGRLTSDSGTYSGSVLIVLDPVPGTDGRQPTFAYPEWTQDAGETVAAFSFADVPEGEYDLRVMSLGDLRTWTPSNLRVTAPMSELELRCADQESVQDWGFSAYDADTGKLLTDVVVCCRTPDGIERAYKRVPESGRPQWQLIAENMVWARIDGELPVQGLPRDAHFEWAVVAEGYAPSYGTEESFVSTENGLVATTFLNPGWGAQVRVVDLAGTPIDTALIQVDERSATDLTPGEFQLVSEEPPDLLRILAPGYQFASGPYRPETERLLGHRVWYEIRLQPE